jgi:hypothetical protein
MTPGQMLVSPATQARFRVVETSSDGSRAVVEGVRTGGRLLVRGDGRGGYWATLVTDTGESGPSLFASLIPRGARFRLREAGA